MELVQFDRLKAQIKTASPYQLLALETLIDLAISGQFVEMALARRTEKTVQTKKCPHCSSNNVVLHGRDQNKRQRFNCRGCRRTYNIMTGTSMARARKPEKWNRYLACMTEHLSVRTIVKTGIGINQVTAWRWRHRFLLAAANDNAAILTGVIQANATLLPWSFKGSRDWKRGKPPADRAARSRGLGAAMLGLSGADVPVLTALDSGLSVFDAVLESLSDIEETLNGRIAVGSVLCSDGSAGYANVADKANALHYNVSDPTTIMHFTESNPRHIPDTWPRRLGLGKVNAHHEGLKYLIDDRCRGVATKYLRNYLGWHRAMVRPGFQGKALLHRALSLI